MMRIACVYLPSFPLQVHVRNAPHLAGTSFAVAELGERPKIAACSRLAWEQGVRPGMSATQARAIAPDVQIAPGQPELYQRTMQSLGESLMAFSVTVDISDGDPPVPRNKSLYLHVPTGTRGQAFGTALLAHLDKQGLRGRVGIAAARFTAWAAAAIAPKKETKAEPDKQLSLAAVAPENPNFVRATTTVPRGGAAAFLSPFALELLPIEDEVRQMLHTLGIHTLGDFAALPPPSVGRRWSSNGVDYQALARGDGPTVLTPLTPIEVIVETIDCDDELSDLEPISFLLRPLIDRACERLRGRGMAAARLQLTLYGPESSASPPPQVVIAPSRPTLATQTLLDLMRAKLGELSLEHPVLSLRLEITRESEPEACELDLFDHRDATVSADAVDIAIARLQAALGEDSVSSAELVDTHRPEKAFKLTPFSPPRKDRKRLRRAKRKLAQRKQAKSERADGEMILPLVLSDMVGAMRLIEPPQVQPRGLRALNVGDCTHKVVASHGPTRLDSEWWKDDSTQRDYYEVETDDGGRYWVYKAEGEYYLHGIFD
ncbi:MAG: hypothetical protein KJO07_13520 [Deltaproteobacteria bacterium]|nr:hypothetical protein [Deltaproteobacteria bacterium]